MAEEARTPKAGTVISDRGVPSGSYGEPDQCRVVWRWPNSLFDGGLEGSKRVGQEDAEHLIGCVPPLGELL